MIKNDESGKETELQQLIDATDQKKDEISNNHSPGTGSQSNNSLTTPKTSELNQTLTSNTSSSGGSARKKLDFDEDEVLSTRVDEASPAPDENATQIPAEDVIIINETTVLDFSKEKLDTDQVIELKEKDDFSTEESSSQNETDDFDRIDYVLVYNKKTSIYKKDLEFYLENLKTNGLILTEKVPNKSKDTQIIPNYLERPYFNSKTYKDDLVYVLIRTPTAKLLEMAEKLKIRLPIHENVIRLNLIENRTLKEDGLAQSWWDRCLDPFQLPLDIRPPKMRHYFTAPYTSNLKNKFSKFMDKNKSNLISNKDRILITYSILSRTTYSRKLYEPKILFSESDANAGINRLLASGTFLAAYPLHDSYSRSSKTGNSRFMGSGKSERQVLWSYWANPKKMFLYQPIHLIRNYFGEKLAFYFSWLGFYTTWLILPSIVGIFVFIYGWATLGRDIPTNEICNSNITMCPLCENGNCDFWNLKDSCTYSRITYTVDNPGTIFFSIFMAVWTVLFIEFWKREQSRLQFQWDIIDYEKNIESVRPEFEAKASKFAAKRKNPITGENEHFVPMKKRLQKYAISAAVVLFMICLVLALVFGVIVYRIVLMVTLFKTPETRRLSGYITSVTAASLNLVIIIILSRFYAWLAEKLTDMEYHKTDSQYEDSLTIKMYLFQFVNFYASIFYIAFLKGRKIISQEFEEECDQAGCLIELCIQLAIIMVGKQILNNVQEVLYPILTNIWNRGIKRNSKLPRWRQDYNLLSWTNLTLFDEYLEMVIQFGFITLFVVAFPLGPLFALFNNILEIRIDAFKVLTQLRRPLPKKAQHIGVWLPILNTISKLGVITNGLIIAFTSDFIPRMVYRFTYSNGSLAGYVNHTLSVKSTLDIGFSEESRNMTLIHATCNYKDFRESYDAPNKYDKTIEYYLVLVARLAFFLIFEHLVFSIVALMHWIPDVPKIIQDQIEAETIITQRAVWDLKPNQDSDPKNNVKTNLKKRKIEKLLVTHT